MWGGRRCLERYSRKNRTASGTFRENTQDQGVVYQSKTSFVHTTIFAIGGMILWQVPSPRVGDSVGTNVVGGVEMPSHPRESLLIGGPLHGQRRVLRHTGNTMRFPTFPPQIQAFDDDRPFSLGNEYVEYVMVGTAPDGTRIYVESNLLDRPEATNLIRQTINEQRQQQVASYELLYSGTSRVAQPRQTATGSWNEYRSAHLEQQYEPTTQRMEQLRRQREEGQRLIDATTGDTSGDWFIRNLCGPQCCGRCEDAQAHTST